MLRVDGKRGALCKITDATDESRRDTIRKLTRLAKWCDYFGLKHMVGDILQWANSGCNTILTLGGEKCHSAQLTLV